MSKVTEAFSNSKAFIPFLTAGDPNIEKTENYILELEKAGADLIEIGIQNCDLVAVCIGSKVETSILVTLNVLNLGVPVISKATSAEQGEVLAKLGATVVYPERDMALRIAKRILRKNLVDFLPIGKDIEIIEIEVSDRMVGKTIVDMDLRRRYSLNVIAIHHEEQIETDVRPDCRLCHGDTITVIGKEENVTRFADDYS